MVDVFTIYKQLKDAPITILGDVDNVKGIIGYQNPSYHLPQHHHLQMNCNLK
jgi:hypothetical protein